MTYLLIGIGGFLGCNARYLLGGWIAERYGTSFPYGTMVINVSGSFIIGFFLALISERFIVHPNWRLFFAIGFLGGTPPSQRSALRPSRSSRYGLSSSRWRIWSGVLCLGRSASSSA